MAAMPSSSLSASTFPFCNNSPLVSAKPKLSLNSLPTKPSKHLHPLKPSTLTLSNSRTCAAPEAMEAQQITLEVAPKQKIRIKLRSYWVPLIEDSCKQITEAARTTNAKIMGPVPLPTKRRVYCVLKSPHVNKDARFHFEIRTHQRLIDILYPTAQTINSLMQLDLPAGVDVQVEL